MSSNSQLRWAALALASVLGLAGCTPGDQPGGSGDTEPSSTPSASTHVSSSPSSAEPTAPAESHPIPLSIACESVISPQTMYEFNPNFSLLMAFVPPADSYATKAIEAAGTICRWVNNTSGDWVDVSLAHLLPESYDAALATARTGVAIDASGVEIYFASIDGVGIIQGFSEPYWVTLSSVYFEAPHDGLQLFSEAFASVG